MFLQVHSSWKNWTLKTASIHVHLFFFHLKCLHWICIPKMKKANLASAPIGFCKWLIRRDQIWLSLIWRARPLTVAYLSDCATMFSHIVKQWVTLSFLVVARSFFLQENTVLLWKSWKQNKMNKNISWIMWSHYLNHYLSTR